MLFTNEMTFWRRWTELMSEHSPAPPWPQDQQIGWELLLPTKNLLLFNTRVSARTSCTHRRLSRGMQTRL